MNNTFSIHRIVPFIKYKLVLNYKTWLIQLAAFTGIFTMINGLVFLDYEVNNSHFKEIYTAFYMITLFACGMYISSRSFHELSNTSKGFLFMQLPLSTFEKISIPIIGTSILFPILFSVFYTLVARMSNGFWSIFYHFDYYSFPFLRIEQFTAFKLYFFIQPLFLIGSIHFKKQHLLWTTISLLGIFAIFLTFWFPFSKAIFKDFSNINSLFGTGIIISEQGMTPADMVWIISMLIFWCIAYFKLKEREI